MGSISTIRKPPHSKTFGLEIECYPNVTCTEGTRLGFWEATYDASLRYAGIEFVCQPMPYSMAQKQIKKLNFTVKDWQVDERCGLHIHVSRKYWSEQREEACSQWISHLTAAQMSTLFGRWSRFAQSFAERGDKFRAINVLHEDTFEFRLWKAGDLAWTLEALRRTKLMVEYHGKWSYEKCLELFNNPEKAQTFPVRRVRRVPVNTPIVGV